MPTIVDQYSVVSLKLRLLCNDKSLSEATGFLYEYGDKLFLVSNWHVFSGRRCDTGQPINKHCAIPDTIDIAFWLKGIPRKWKRARIKLYDEQGEPRWRQHPDGQHIDVAVMRINKFPESIDVQSLPRSDEVSDMAFQVANDVFLVGFPLGLAHDDMFPIWKRGSVATEPQIPFKELPVFLVDSSTREGMSGAPVYVRSFGICVRDNGSGSISDGSHTRFIGVYSGRYTSKDELEAQLAQVWHRSVIDEIIAGRVPGSYELTT